ncbi:MAG: hypothetical protein IT462_03255 [Planctomycetes bacterium]|nr:hypothetical protein [Planctomycetota bacterium]
MSRRIVLLAVACTCLAGALRAADDLKLAVSFPSSTVIYIEVASPEVLENLSQPQFLEGLIPGFKAPNLAEMLSKELGMQFTAEELGGLVGGVRRGAIGLLDIAVSGPRLQVIIDHKNPAALARALKAAAAPGNGVELAETFEGEPIYNVQLPVKVEEAKPGIGVGSMLGGGHIKKWLAQMANVYLSIQQKRYIVVTSSINAMKDALDFMAFPDDTTDTLVGNARYKEALAEFEKPQGLLFVNTNSLIQAIERITGDKGTGPVGKMETAQFFINLVEYKQLKSFAAGWWVDDEKQRVRMDAKLQFHFAPGWYEASRTAPGAQAMAEYVPTNAIFAFTNNIEKPGDLFVRARNFVLERAKEAGREEVIKHIQDMDSDMQGSGMKAEDLLNQFSGGAAVIVVPATVDGRSTQATAMLMRMKDRAKTEEMFYDSLKNAGMGKDARQTDREIEFFEGVEIHFREQNSRRVAFAFYEDIYLNGDRDAIRAVIGARKNKKTLADSPAFADARGAIWEKAAGTMVLNYGAIVSMMGNLRFSFGGPQKKKAVVEDCTEADDNPGVHIAEFMADTTVVIGAIGRDKEIVIRYSAAKWPRRAQFKSLAELFKDVERNKTIRDRFADVQRAALAHLALKGKAPEKADDLTAAGYVQKAETVLDPYGDDDGGKRQFKLAAQAAEVDVRQPILLAYQEKPGLRGRHMAVLWTGDVVSFSPEELADAQERAKMGEAVKGRKVHAALTDPKGEVPPEAPERKFK